jgi:hypothetical protein
MTTLKSRLTVDTFRIPRLKARRLYSLAEAKSRRNQTRCHFGLREDSFVDPSPREEGIGRASLRFGVKQFETLARAVAVVSAQISDCAAENPH